MKVAFEEAEKSNDPVTKVGCVYVNKNGIIASKGHNSVNANINIDLSKISRNYKRYLMTHAEVNAIKNMSNFQHKSLIAYCTLAPCIECIKLMYNIGVKKVYYDQLLGSNKTINMEKINAIRLLTNNTIELINYSTGISFNDEIRILI